MVVDGCGWLRVVVDGLLGGYGWLWMVLDGCVWLWAVVDGCGWLWVVAYFSITRFIGRFSEETKMYPGPSRQLRWALCGIR